MTESILEIQGNSRSKWVSAPFRSQRIAPTPTCVPPLSNGGFGGIHGKLLERLKGRK
jgi:hypothetical protein